MIINAINICILGPKDILFISEHTWAKYTFNMLYSLFSETYTREEISTLKFLDYPTANTGIGFSAGWK